MDLDSGAGLLHRLTSYLPDREWDEPADDPRVRHDLAPNDPDTLPPPVKAYPPGLPVTALPRDLAAPDVAATAVLSGRPGPSAPLDAARLGRILFLGAGVVRTTERNGRTVLFRASGSAGARFPLEVYAVTTGVVGVPDGVHWYDPVAHALVQVGPAAGGATALVVTGVPWRTGWRYAERGFRHLYWDAGTLLSQLEAVAVSAGHAPRLITRFPDARVRDLVGADGVHEFPLALLTVDGGVPATAPAGPAAHGELPEVEFPLVTAAQRAGDSGSPGDPWPPAPPIEPTPRPTPPDTQPETPGPQPGTPAGKAETPGSQPGTPAARPGEETIDDVIRRRGSQRRMDRSRTVPAQALDWPLAAALRGIDVPHWIAVHGVDGVPPGLYRWPDLGTPVYAGDLRDELTRICLDQALGGDAAYVVIAAIDGSTLDDRGYREAQLAAGIVEGRLHLAAYALGATATGMTFLDSAVPALLREDDTLVTLLFTCVGVAEYRSRPGGGPGAPVAIRGVVPRMGTAS
ncbi:hypothetical protein J2S43_002412 [Catenuloplanes nepalensis]|uniref:Nitroreductase domain-containing protein n=1 Tax=Catenuloplanes nepalensis TaxID=587533 RepID=A0ABT9MR47_9ACTN|nr:hypothetical protein [Catenuloplanes nepalensis]MDP9793900.1 hypothetical protein [Catenuloplanes nepalensis]